MFLLDKNFLQTPVEGKVDPYSRAAFISWLETKDPAAAYDYCDTDNCPFAQYAKHIGAFNPAKHPTAFHSIAKHFPASFRAQVTVGLIGVVKGRTFGAALFRAREVMGIV